MTKYAVAMPQIADHLIGRAVETVSGIINKINIVPKKYVYVYVYTCLHEVI